MDSVTDRQMMTLLYGSPTTYCYSCRAYLTDPEKAHPKQHPQRPFQTIAMCDDCNSGKAPLRIREPKLQTCRRCEQDFLPRDGGKLSFCSESCAKTPEQQTPPKALMRVESRKSCGPCDCEDYATLGYCTMVAQAPQTPEDKRVLIEPWPKSPQQLRNTPA
jgi:hypothetical protein